MNLNPTFISLNIKSGFTTIKLIFSFPCHPVDFRGLSPTLPACLLIGKTDGPYVSDENKVQAGLSTFNQA